MNRVLLACNAILALFLVLRLVNTGSPALAADKSAAWRAEDLRLVAADLADLATAVARPAADGQARAEALPTNFLLHLGAEVAALPVSSSPVALGLVSEPPLELVTVWQSSSILRVAVLSELQPATRYQLRFVRELESLDGRVLPAGSEVTLTTPNVQLRDVLVEDDPLVAPGRGDAALRVRLSLPVDPIVAEKGLGLRDAESGEDLAVSVELLGGRDSTLFRLRMKNGELPPTVRVVLRQGLVPKHGKLPLMRDQVRLIDVYEPLDLRAAEASSDSVYLTFNRAIAVPDAKFVRVTPAGQVRFETTERGLRIGGEFAAGSLVTIDLEPGFPGTGPCRGRSSLGSSVRRTVLVPDRQSSVAILGDGEILSARAEPILTLCGCNTTKVTLQLRRVYANNVVRMMQRSDSRVFEPEITREIPIVAARNVEWQERVDLRDLLGAQPRGIYEVEVWSQGQYWPAKRLLQITDLGVTVRAGADGAAVQVVSIADGVACADAQVTIVTPTNQELAKGSTDAEGKVLLSWRSGASDRKPFLVQVQHGDDQVFVGMERCGVELADEGLGGRAYLRDRAEAMVWPSRGIVRPGESLDVAVLVRDAAGAAAVDRELAVVFTAPGGKEFGRQRTRADGSGLFSARLELPADAPCGQWSATVLEVLAQDARVAIGRGNFEVATFVPNRLEATATVVGEVHHGAPLVVHVQGNWLDGTPANGRPVQVHVRLTNTAYSAENRAEYSFASGLDLPPPGELPAVDAVLDEHGMADLRLQLPPLGAEQFLMAVVQAEVLDPSGRPVRAQTQHLVWPTEVVLGVRVGDGRVDVCSVAEHAASDDRGPCTVRIERRHWEWRYDAREANRWAWRSLLVKEVVHEATVSLVQGVASLDLPAFDGSGWFAAIVTRGEQRAEQILGRAPRAPDRLRVRAANQPAPGEVALLDVESPAAGRGFVTLETDTVLSANVLQLAAGNNRIEVPVPAGTLLPDLHVVVTLTRPVASAKPGEGPAWLVGAADVRLSRPELASAVRVVTAAQVLPEAHLHVAIEAPGASRAIVAVVDEGVLAVTGHASPDPLAFVLASRQLTVDGADTGARLVRDMVFAPRSKTGGDDDEDLGAMMRGGSVDTHIRPLALFAEVTLVEGVGVAEFVLPTYEGRVRVMVIAAGSRRVGSAAADVTVKAPLGLQVALPRMVAPGDRFVVPVSLRNDLGKDVVVTFDVQAPTTMQLPGGTHYEVPVAMGRTANVDVPVVAVAAAEGLQTFTVIASAAGEVRTVSDAVPVRSLRLPEREYLGFRLGAEQTVRVAEGWSAEDLHAELSIDVAPDRQLRPALEAMLSYPYGCCEQTASRGMALANCAVLLPRLYDDPKEMPQVLSLVQAAVDRVFTMQGTRGGFGWWYGDRSEDAFLTIHVMDFLGQAREVGAQVAENGFARAMQRLQEYAFTAPELELRCQAIEVLARLGQPVQPRLDWLCSQPVPLAARARLATALALLGERQRASDLLQHGDEAAPVEREREAGNLYSPIRTQALLLRAQLAIDPGHESLPGQVLALQQQLLQPRFLSTQELAQGLRAVADYYRRQPTPAEAAHANVLVDGVAVTVGSGRPAELSIHPGSNVKLAAGGQGFALLRLRGYAPVVAHDDDRLVLHREIVDLETGLATTRLRRGRVYEVRIHAEVARGCSDVVVVDVLPAGCEAEPVVAGDALRDGGDEEQSSNVAAATEHTLVPLHLEPRDDRVLMFFRSMPPGQFVLRHRIRAVFPGDYEAPPVIAQGMYDATLQVSEVGRMRVEIVP